MLTAGGYNTRRRFNLKAASSLQKTAESIPYLESPTPVSSPSGPPELKFDDPINLPDHLLGVVGMYSCAGYEEQFNGKLAAKTNQDCAGVRYPFGRHNMVLLAVYDGHGRSGHFASKFAHDEIPKRLKEHKAFPHDLERAFEETALGIHLDLDHGLELLDSGGTTVCGGVLQDDNLARIGSDE